MKGGGKSMGVTTKKAGGSMWKGGNKAPTKPGGSKGSGFMSKAQSSKGRKMGCSSCG